VPLPSALPVGSEVDLPATAPVPPRPGSDGRSLTSHVVELTLLGSVLLFVVLFWRLGGATFWDPDEAHYAETTREMFARHDWLAPYYNDAPFFDKPPLFHMLQAAAMWLFGYTEFAARIVPAVAALALIGLTGWLGATLVSAEVGAVAAVFLAASPGVFGLARYAIFDTLFTAFVFGGAGLLTVAALRDRTRLQYAGYVLIALAVLTKGPLALVLCGLTLAAASVVSADARRRLLALRWVVGLALIIAIAAPWFVYMYLRFGDVWVQGYVLDENLRLYGGRRFANQPGAWFYFQILASGLLPWTGLLIGRLVDDARAVWRRERLDTLEILLWAWTFSVVGFFTLSTFKLDHYVFPAAPALCLLCARAWSDVRADRESKRNAGALVGLHLVGPFLVLIGLGAGVFLIARLELPRAAAAVPIAVTLAGVFLTARVNIRGGIPPKVPWIVMTAMTISYAGIVGFVMPALEHRKVVPDLARWTSVHVQESDRIATYRLNRWEPAWRFYVGRHTTFLEDASAAEAFFRSPEPFYCAMNRKAFDEFVARGVPLRIVYGREGMWATSGRVLWRRRLPPVHFVVVTNKP
jgi:4-amino-4-deoxy-L-arabinose transferase-like glycosyltransferase